MIVREVQHDYGVGMLAAVLGLIALVLIAFAYAAGHPGAFMPPATTTPSAIASPAADSSPAGGYGYCPGCGDPAPAATAAPAPVPPLICYSSGDDGSMTCRLP